MSPELLATLFRAGEISVRERPCTVIVCQQRHSAADKSFMCGKRGFILISKPVGTVRL
jgi:hypothetical protein